jgi:hypothetical protein
MPKTSRNSPTADQIEEITSRGEDVSAYFTNNRTVVRPVRRVNADLTRAMLRELDAQGARLGVSRQGSHQDMAAAAARPGDRGAIACEREGGLTGRQ